MSSYKKNKRLIGESDIASLTLRGPNKLVALDFSENGSYYAYIVKGDKIKIPKRYKHENSFSDWLWIYDDVELTACFTADKIDVYRDDKVCLIHLQRLNKDG